MGGGSRVEGLGVRVCGRPCGVLPPRTAQGYLAHKKPHPPRTLQHDYAYGPTAVLGGGRVLMSEVALFGMPPPPGIEGLIEQRRKALTPVGSSKDRPPTSTSRDLSPQAR